MKYWTWAEVKQKIDNDMDLQEEPDLLSENELMGYVNDAIDVVEQHFIKMGDYFLSTEKINIMEEERDYDLPEDIYATKIRKILCDSDYEVRPLKDLKYVSYQESSTNSFYKYLIINNPGSKPKIRLIPTPMADGVLDIYYTRNANRLSVDAGDYQYIDLPEAMGFIITYVKLRIYEKEKSPMYQMYYTEIQKQEEMLIDALSQRIDDENNEIEIDINNYLDMF